MIDDEAPSGMSLDEMADLALAMAQHAAESKLKLRREQVLKKLDPGSRPG